MNGMAALLAIVALAPAAGNAGASALSTGPLVPLCTADGGMTSIALDPGGSGVPSKSTTPCCQKGCRTANSRKRKSMEIDPRQ